MPADLDQVHDELQACAEHVQRRHSIPAVVWGVVLDGRLAVSGGAGVVAGAPVTSDTAFRIASMTKSFTAAAILVLRDEGIVPSLDEPVPGITPPTADAAPVTLRLLLSMGAGFVTDDPWADRHLDIDPADFDDMIAAGVSFAASPATTFEYSNLGYGVIGRTIARCTGELPQTVIERRVLRPLGLGRTAWAAPADGDWARPFHLQDGIVRPDGPLLADGALATMGGLWSTVADLARWIAWLDDAFPARDDRDDGPLRRSSRREMQTVHRATPLAITAASGDGPDHVPARIDGGGYGFGLQIIHDDRFGVIAGHSGGLPGYGSNMRWLPGRRVGVVALANTRYAPMRLLTQRMLELLDDRGVVPPRVAPVTPALRDAAHRLVALLNDWDDGAATDLFADNVALDESFARRADAARAVVTEHGQLRVVDVVAGTATEATVAVIAADGSAASVEVLLAPLATPLVQRYRLQPGAA
ncbi:MAG: serine hydrolase domain-containing protein [Ilumatobacteraceae bacterium]